MRKYQKATSIPLEQMEHHTNMILVMQKTWVTHQTCLMEVCNLLVWHKKEFGVANSLHQYCLEIMLTENTKDLV